MGFGNWLADRTGIHPTVIAGKVKDAATGVAHAEGNVLNNKYTKLALAAGLTATGVGAPAAAAIMAGSGLLGGALHEGGGLKDALVGGATGAAEGYGASKLGGVARTVGGALMNGGAPGASSADGGYQLPEDAGNNGSDDLGNSFGFGDGSNGYNPDGTPASGGSAVSDGLTGLARKVGGAVVNGVTGAAKSAISGAQGMSPLDIAMAGLATQQGIASANATKRAGDMSDKALQLSQQNWSDAAPLRTQGQSRLLSPTRPQLANVYTNTSNPFAAQRRPLPMTPLRSA